MTGQGTAPRILVLGATGLAGLAAMGGSDSLSSDGALAGGGLMILTIIVFYLG